MPMYHATSWESAANILADGFSTGWDGLLGGAVYLSTQHGAAIQKSRGNAECVMVCSIPGGNFPEFDRGQRPNPSIFPICKVRGENSFAIFDPCSVTVNFVTDLGGAARNPHSMIAAPANDCEDEYYDAAEDEQYEDDQYEGDQDEGDQYEDDQYEDDQYDDFADCQDDDCGDEDEDDDDGQSYYGSSGGFWQGGGSSSGGYGPSSYGSYGGSRSSPY